MSTLLPSTTPARPLLKAEWLPMLLGAVLSVVAGSVLLVGWRAGLLPVLDYPLSYSGDAFVSLP